MHEEGRNEARYSNFYVSFICNTSLNNEMLFWNGNIIAISSSMDW